MKKIFTSIILVSLLAVSCSTSKKTTAKSVSNSTQNSTTSSVQDGSTFEKAIIINEKEEMKGVSAEYKWLSEHYPGYKTEKQRLLFNDKIPYDVISVTLADGKKMDVYFNISKFFGKF